jgi:hypothetical protein
VVVTDIFPSAKRRSSASCKRSGQRAGSSIIAEEFEIGTLRPDSSAERGEQPIAAYALLHEVLAERGVDLRYGRRLPGLMCGSFCRRTRPTFRFARESYRPVLAGWACIRLDARNALEPDLKDVRSLSRLKRTRPAWPPSGGRSPMSQTMARYQPQPDAARQTRSPSA